MATTIRGSGASVADRLTDEPYRFEFYAAVRALEHLYPDQAPVGEGPHPSAEAVRFRSHADLGFPASDVVDIEPATDEDPAEMTVSFMSLAGPHGPLPAPYAELLQDCVRSGNMALRDFFDLLVHRLIALRYRSRKRHHVGMASSPTSTSGASGNTIARYLRAIAGLGPDATHDRLAVPDQALLRYATLLTQSPPSAHGLSVLLSDYFDTEVDVTPLTGTWIPLEPHQRTRLGCVGQNNTLGQSTVLGTRAWDQQGGLTIEVGAPSLDTYLRLLPDGDAHRALVDLAQLYLGRTVTFDLSVTMDADDVPHTPLSGTLGPRLGRSAWLGTPLSNTVTTDIRPETFDPAQEVLRIPLFAGLSPNQLREVTAAGVLRDVRPDQHVARQGRSASAFYLLVEGEADVRYQSPQGDASTVLTTLEPGGVFGDEALIHEQPYDASLVTTRSSRILEIRREQLETLRDRYPSIERALEATYHQADDAEAPPSPPPHGLGAHLSPALWHHLRQAGRIGSVEKGASIVPTGRPTDALHILLDGGPVTDESGTQVDAPGTPLNLRALVERRTFDAPRRATQAATLLVLPRADLRRLCQKHRAIERALRTWHARRTAA